VIVTSKTVIAWILAVMLALGLGLGLKAKFCGLGLGLGLAVGRSWPRPYMLTVSAVKAELFTYAMPCV